MKIDVFDTYVTVNGREQMHFDVLVKSGVTQETAQQYAHEWLNTIGVMAESLQQQSCRFCHSEMANPEVDLLIERQGYAILQMEGCPAPIYANV